MDKDELIKQIDNIIKGEKFKIDNVISLDTICDVRILLSTIRDYLQKH